MNQNGKINISYLSKTAMVLIQPKQWVILLVAFYATIMSTIIILNCYAVVSEYFLREKTHELVGSILANGDCVLASELDFTKISLSLIKQSKKAHEKVIFGSSHVHTCNPPQGWHIVSHGGLPLSFYNDALNCYTFHHKRTPQKIILAIPAWVFSKIHATDRLSPFGLYRKLNKDFNFFRKIYCPAIELYSAFSRRYLDIRYGYNFLKKNHSSFSFKKIPGNLFNFDYPLSQASWLDAPNGRKQAYFAKNINPNHHSKVVLNSYYSGYKILDNTEAIALLLKKLKYEKYSIAIYLSPNNPQLLKTLKTVNRLWCLTDAEKQIKTLAAELEIPVIGSYDPSLFGFTEEDFFDAHHPKPHVHELLLQKIDSIFKT